MNDGIKHIEIIFDNGDTLDLDSSFFSNFYISNINENADEIPYEKIMNTNNLYANFVSMKLLNKKNNHHIMEKLLSNLNIDKIKLNISDSKSITFNIVSSADPFKKNDINKYNKSFTYNDDFCLLICPYKLKYKENIFI